MIVKSSQTLVSSSGSQSRHDNDRDCRGPDELWLSLAICSVLLCGNTYL